MVCGSDVIRIGGGVGVPVPLLTVSDDSSYSSGSFLFNSLGAVALIQQSRRREELSLGMGWVVDRIVLVDIGRFRKLRMKPVQKLPLSAGPKLYRKRRRVDDLDLWNGERVDWRRQSEELTECFTQIIISPTSGLWSLDYEQSRMRDGGRDETTKVSKTWVEGGEDNLSNGLNSQEEGFLLRTREQQHLGDIAPSSAVKMKVESKYEA
ncbi:hypothetical protein BY996DRAFT_6487972 [Phakopsora pachyrhizi]|nr:hypothetical protein BY996DRAFT_6487972 [Phakopsora pachyrhizi]